MKWRDLTAAELELANDAVFGTESLLVVRVEVNAADKRLSDGLHISECQWRRFTGADKARVLAEVGRRLDRISAAAEEMRKRLTIDLRGRPRGKRVGGDGEDAEG